ncbi:MAG TPA: LysR substrate-binding domain-containing protein [Novosphingobium sp.]|nr:LysR substrate-binding domain-containing protein [Novosphingobium sp.]
MLRQTPPLEAAEAFLVAARSSSFRAAAAAMALSPSALSRRIQLLESFLDAPLFDRSGPRAVLTDTGRRYLEAIQPAVETIRRASADIRKPRRDSIRIAMSHSLAVEWLLPRLGYVQRELGIGVDIVVTRDRQALRDQEVDLAIWGALTPDHGEGELLVTLDAVPASAPVLADGRRPPQTVAELATYPLLEVRTPPDFWRQWFSAVGHRGAAPEPDAIYGTNQLSLGAASAGLGIVLAVPLLANLYLEDGRLRPCAVPPIPTGMGYWIHHASQSARRDTQARSLVEWLKAEAQTSRERFTTMVRDGTG